MPLWLKRLGKKVSCAFGSGNMDVESNKVGWDRAKEIREVIFTLIESGVVIGVLKALLLSTQSDVAAILYILAYLALGVYTLSLSNMVVALLFERLGWSDQRSGFVNLFRLITFAISLALPYGLDALTSDALVSALK